MTEDGGGQGPDEFGTAAIEEFGARFAALAEEARAAGVASVVILTDRDPLAGVETGDYSFAGCGPAVAAGMVQVTLWRMERDFLRAEDDDERRG